MARDFVLYGDDEFDTFLEMYDINNQQFQEISKLPEFIALQKDYRNEMKSKGKAYLKARTILEEQLNTLNLIIANPAHETADRIKAMELVAKIADALPKNNAPASTGMNVSINFGSTTATRTPAAPADIIEAIDG